MINFPVSNGGWWLALSLLLTVSQAAPAGGGLKTLEAPRAVARFELPGTDGRLHRLSDYRGRYLLVNFWAVWCTPCRREMPSMERAYQRLRGERFEMLAIHVGPSLEQARTYVEQLGLTFPVAVDEQMSLSAWQVSGLPTSFLLDPEGRIVAEAVGERDWDSSEMVEEIEGYLRGE